jgi:[protein-PII] uridylyltransferase
VTAAPSIEQIRSELKQARQAHFERWTPKANPEALLREHAKIVDRALIALWALVQIPGSALVAVGGYGRGELAPYSDIDLLVLMPEGYQDSEIAPYAETLVTALWDIGLDVGHSIRSVSECIEQANQDVSIATALLESRGIAGPQQLVRNLKKAWTEQIQVADFAQSKLLEMQQRHARHQDTPYSLEPNCKESPGGLRDLQVLRWVTTAFGLSPKWQDLARDGLITPIEARELARGQKRLLLIRGHLHLAAGRREDRLVFDLQNAVAARMDMKPKGNRRASEVLMQGYYRSAKVVLQISSMLLANLEPRLFPSPSMSANAQPRDIDEDFQEVYGLLELRDAELFERKPDAILRAFLIVQQHSELRGMSPKTIRAIWNHRDRIDTGFRRAPEHRALFLELFKQPQGIVHGLRLMNDLGVLGRMLPVFRRIVGQMQHDLFHVYTVDQHILQVIRNLRRLTMDEHAHEFPLCSRLMAQFQWPWVLYIAALFHDIAKGRGGDHSELGKFEVRRFAKDYGLDKETQKLLSFLVEHHLTMSSVAQKQDLADPETIQQFAKLVKTPHTLTALYLLTVADIRGTSPKVWNNWKARLLEELYHKTLQLLSTEGQRAQTQVDFPHDAFYVKTQEAERLLRLHGRDPQAAKEFWKTLELQYFLRHDPNDIEWHARMLAWQSTPDKPIVLARVAPDEVGLQVVVYQHDEHDLFARICAFFDAQNLSVLDAKIHTTSTGYALDTFVVDHRQFHEHQREMANIVEAGLAAALQNRATLPEPVKGRISRQSRYFPIPPTVDLRPDSRGQFHVLTVTAADRSGLLYSIARTLVAHRVSLQTARVMTLGERAEDTFLIEGEGLEENRKQIQLEKDLLKALAA